MSKDKTRMNTTSPVIARPDAKLSTTVKSLRWLFFGSFHVGNKRGVHRNRTIGLSSKTNSSTYKVANDDCVISRGYQTTNTYVESYLIMFTELSITNNPYIVFVVNKCSVERFQPTRARRRCSNRWNKFSVNDELREAPASASGAVRWKIKKFRRDTYLISPERMKNSFR